MLIISKKKLYVTRGLMWGGVCIAGLGILVSFAVPSDTDLNLILLAVGLGVSLIGAFAMRRLFRCPNCKRNVLPNESGVDLRTEKCPEACPHCGTKIRIEG